MITVWRIAQYNSVIWYIACSIKMTLYYTLIWTTAIILKLKFNPNRRLLSTPALTCLKHKNIKKMQSCTITWAMQAATYSQCQKDLSYAPAAYLLRLMHGLRVERCQGCVTFPSNFLKSIQSKVSLYLPIYSILEMTWFVDLELYALTRFLSSVFK